MRPPGRDVHTANLGDNLQERVSQQTDSTDHQKVSSALSEKLLSLEIFGFIWYPTQYHLVALDFYFIKTGRWCQGRSQDSARNRKIYKNLSGQDFIINNSRTSIGNKYKCFSRFRNFCEMLSRVLEVILALWWQALEQLNLRYLRYRGPQIWLSEIQ